MKPVFMLFLILVSQITFAQTLKEKKTKAEMLKRVDTLIEKTEAGSKALKTEDVSNACEIINDMFKILPDHLVSIGTRMNLFDSKIIKMENETKMFLIEMHRRSNICASGDETGENLDIGETDKQFKKMNKSFKKQKKTITKGETNYNNIYNYYYEF